MGNDLDWEGVDDSQARLTALVTMLSPLFRQQTFKAGEHLANQVPFCLLCCQMHFVVVVVLVGRPQLGPRQHSFIAELAAAAARRQGSCSCSQLPCLGLLKIMCWARLSIYVFCWEECAFAACFLPGWLATS